MVSRFPSSTVSPLFFLGLEFCVWEGRKKGTRFIRRLLGNLGVLHKGFDGSGSWPAPPRLLFQDLPQRLLAIAAARFLIAGLGFQGFQGLRRVCVWFRVSGFRV